MGSGPSTRANGFNLKLAIGCNMGFLDKVLVGGVVALAGIGASAIYRREKETNRRINSPITFTDASTHEDFV